MNAAGEVDDAGTFSPGDVAARERAGYLLVGERDIAEFQFQALLAPEPADLRAERVELDPVIGEDSRKLDGRVLCAQGQVSAFFAGIELAAEP